MLKPLPAPIRQSALTTWLLHLDLQYVYESFEGLQGLLRPGWKSTNASSRLEFLVSSESGSSILKLDSKPECWLFLQNQLVSLCPIYSVQLGYRTSMVHATSQSNASTIQSQSRVNQVTTVLSNEPFAPQLTTQLVNTGCGNSAESDPVPAKPDQDYRRRRRIGFRATSQAVR